MSTNNLTDAKELFIKMAIMAWDTHIDRMNKLLDELTDEQLAAQTATGRNTGIYLLGHLTAVHDRIIPLLGVGERLFPQLEELFVTSPDKSGLSFPSVTELKKYWNQRQRQGKPNLQKSQTQMKKCWNPDRHQSRRRRTR